MRKRARRILACVLMLALTVNCFGGVTRAEDGAVRESESSGDPIWDAITEIEDRRGLIRAGTVWDTEDFAALLPEVAATVEGSPTYRKGTLQRGQDAVYWYSADGTYNLYSARLQAEEISWMNSDELPEEPQSLGSDCAERTGQTRPGGFQKDADPGTAAKDVVFLRPYLGLETDNSIYTRDGKLVEYAPLVAEAMGGSFTDYTGTEVTIDVFAEAVQNSALVVLHSHGTCVAPAEGEAPQSYIRIKSSEGITQEDWDQHHAIKVGKTVFLIDGTAITAHMDGAAPNNFIHIGCCSGMRTESICAPLRENGAAVVAGFDATVSSWYDATCIWYFLTRLGEGMTVAEAVSTLKKTYPRDKFLHYDYYTRLVVVSEADEWPTDNQAEEQTTVYSDWTLPLIEPLPLAPSTLSVSLTDPGPIECGRMEESFCGLVETNYTIISMLGRIYTEDGQYIVGRSYVSANEYQTVRLEDTSLSGYFRDRINELPVGRYKVFLRAIDGVVQVDKRILINVVEPSSLDITLSGPASFEPGKMTEAVTGHIASNYELRSVSSALYTEDGQVIDECVTQPAEGCTSFDLRDSGHGRFLKDLLNAQPSGIYRIRVAAEDEVRSSVKEAVVVIAELSSMRVYNMISVSTDMVMSFSARKADVGSYEKFWIEVVKHAPDGDETYLYGADQEAVLTEGNTTWSCDFKHIFAKEMGVDIEARVYAEDAEGQIWMSPAKTTNIRDYLGGRLTATNNKVEQRTLAADMLNYGAAAQVYMDYDTAHLVNEELTAEQLAKLDEYETKDLPVVEKTNSNFRPEGQSNILFNSVSLDNEVILFLTVLGSEGNEVKVLMKDHETGTVLETLDTAWNGSRYTVEYSGIGADKMRVAFDFVAQINGAETGNIRTWSVEGYVGELRSGSNQLQINVANALLTYGDAAAAYFAQ